MVFNPEGFDKLHTDNDTVTVKEEETPLKSGRMSNWYANCRVLTDRRDLKDQLVTHVIDFVIGDLNLEPDYFYGVPEGATKLGLFLTDYYANIAIYNSPLVMGRGKPKEHGEPRDRYFIGPVNEGDRVVIVEDVTTTGSSLVSAINALQEAGVDILAALALVNRLELAQDENKNDLEIGVEELVRNMGVQYHALSDASRLLPLAIANQNPSEEAIAKVEAYFEKYGVQPLKLR